MLFWRQIHGQLHQPRPHDHPPLSVVSRSAALVLGLGLLPSMTQAGGVMESMGTLGQMEKLAPMAAPMAAGLTPESPLMARSEKADAEMGQRFGTFMNSFMNSVERNQEQSERAPRGREEEREAARPPREQERRPDRYGNYGAPYVPLYDPWGSRAWGNPLYGEDPWLGNSWQGEGGGWGRSPYEDGGHDYGYVPYEEHPGTYPYGYEGAGRRPDAGYYEGYGEYDEYEGEGWGGWRRPNPGRYGRYPAPWGPESGGWGW